MSGLKEIRNRISSVSSTMQITNAMKMVSAAKLKKAQDSISATLPYSNKLSGLIQNISTSGESLDSPFFTKRTMNKVLIVHTSWYEKHIARMLDISVEILSGLHNF